MTVKIVYDEKKQMGVPESSITIQGKKAFVYVVNNNVVEKETFKLEKEILEKFQFYQAFQLGKKVVTEGVSKIRNKSKVKIISK